MCFEKVAVSSGDIKNDYLYFDRLLPIFKPDDFIGAIPVGFEDQGETTSPYVSDGIQLHPQIYSRLGKKRKSKLQDAISDGKDMQVIHNIIAPAIQALNKDLRNSKRYEPVPVLSEQINYGDQIVDFQALSIISKNIARVDTASACWEQLREFKIRPESLQALKNYHCFWHTSSIGKSASEVADQLSIRKLELDRACKSHGMKLIDGVAKALIRNHSHYSAALSALAKLIFGDSVSLESEAKSGIMIALADLTMTVAVNHDNKKQFLQNSDMLYLKLIEEEFSKNRT